MFHVEHSGFLFTIMSITAIPYKSGDPIIPGVTYSLNIEVLGGAAWILNSKTVGTILQVTLTVPADESWSNVNTFYVEGEVAGRLLKMDDNASRYYFRVIGPPTLAHDSSLTFLDLNMEWPKDITPIAIPTDGAPLKNGFYSLDALSLEVGKFHSFSIVPAKSGNLVGKHETSDQHRFVATIFGVNTQGYPVSHMASFANTEQAIFNMDTTKAILHLSAPEGAEFNYTCSIASFSSGSGGSLTPSSDATITGAWSFTNVSGLTLQDSAPVIFGEGVDAIKMHGDGLGNAVIEGGNGATLDVAVPMNIQEPVLVTDTITHLFSGVSGEAVVSKFTTDLGSYELRLRKSDGALRLTLAGGGSSIFSTDSQGRMYAVISLSAAYLVSSGDFSVSGSSSLTGGVTMGQTLTVAGKVTLNNGLATTGVTSLGNGLTDPTTISGDCTINSSLQVVGPARFMNTLQMDDGVSIQFGTAASIYATGADIWFEGPADGKTVYNQPIQFSSPPPGEALVATSGLNKEMGDSLYAPKASTFSNTSNQTIYGNWEFNNAPTILDATDGTPLKMLAVKELTQGAYDALTQKENNILYIITETGKVHLGPFLLN